MELGEIDLASLLVKQRMLPHNLSFIRLYWEQVLFNAKAYLPSTVACDASRALHILNSNVNRC